MNRNEEEEEEEALDDVRALPSSPPSSTLKLSLTARGTKHEGTGFGTYFPIKGKTVMLGEFQLRTSTDI